MQPHRGKEAKHPVPQVRLTDCGKGRQGRRVEGRDRALPAVGGGTVLGAVLGGSLKEGVWSRAETGRGNRTLEVSGAMMGMGEEGIWGLLRKKA